MTEIDRQLRSLIISARRDPALWRKKDRRGRPRGLTQTEAAERAGISQVWLRQIESGYVDSAKADTLGSICYALGVDPGLIRVLGYGDVADAVDARIMSREGTLPEEVINKRTTPRPPPAASPEEHLWRTPEITERQKELLVDTLRQLRGEEPLGADMWRRKKRAQRG